LGYLCKVDIRDQSVRLAVNATPTSEAKPTVASSGYFVPMPKARRSMEVLPAMRTVSPSMFRVNGSVSGFVATRRDWVPSAVKVAPSGRIVAVKVAVGWVAVSRNSAPFA